MTRNNNRFFSLIEIVLAIAIIAIGCVSIMALFPAGLVENRKAIIQNNAANSAESMFAYINNNASEDWQTFLTDFPGSKPQSVLAGSDTLVPLQYKTDPDNNNVPILDSNGDKISIGGLYASESNDGVYAIKLKTGKHNDMTGEILVWLTEVKKTYFNKTLVTDTNDTPGSGLGTDSIIGANIELSFPIEKPYSKRDKFQYYFEIFNKNNDATSPATPSVSTDPLFDEDEGVITVNYKSRLSVEVLGTFFAYSDNSKAKVFLQLEVTEPDGTVTISSPFNGGNYLSYLNSNIAITPQVYTQNVEPGSKFRISAKGQCVYYGTIYGPYWSNNSMQADALVDGQVPFPYTPAGSQPGFSTFIKQYVNEKTREVTINDYEILFLFELNSVPKTHKAYDMQDLIVLAGIAKIQISPAEAVALATKEAAETALQAAETALAAAESDKASKLAVLNQVKNSENYSKKQSKRDKKLTSWQNAKIAYNNNPTDKRLRQRDKKEAKYITAETNLDNAKVAIATEQQEYTEAETAYNAALVVRNDAQTVYDVAVIAYNKFV